MKARRSVALLIETSNAYARGLLTGAIEYIRGHEDWSIHLPELQRTSAPPVWLDQWRGDGIIARIETEEMANAILKKKLPTVDVSAARHVPNIPWVETDDRQIAQLAVEHLRERGFKHFGFVGEPGFNWSKWREQHFEAISHQSNLQQHTYRPIPQETGRQSPTTEKERLAKWLDQLPKPIGIMACYDIKAREVLDACRELGILVPEQVAVIGADNDELLCNLSDPPLTSVIPNSRKAGFEAAHLLDRMMSGEQLQNDAILIEPIGIETRQSTDTLAIEDPDVAMALRYIRRNATKGMNVSDLLKEIPLSRRVLESRFQKRLGRTPHQEIVRQKISKVKQLLAETELSLVEIANRTGFDHAEYLSVAFKNRTGKTPRTYRREHRS
jgi:LacI family transcriptional regulator